VIKQCDITAKAKEEAVAGGSGGTGRDGGGGGEKKLGEGTSFSPPLHFNRMNLGNYN
jgi:hypothetical protein